MIRNLKTQINEYVHTQIITIEEWENQFHALYISTTMNQYLEQEQKNRTSEREDKQFNHSY